MEIDTDLTTTETLDDDLEEKDDTTKHEERNKKREEASQGAREAQKARPASPAETEAGATAASDVKMAAELTMPTESPAPQRTTPAGKVTRQNLNGARSPTVMKRLRKSTRSTRFKSKLTGRAGGAAAGGGGATNNGATNGGHNGQGSGTSATPKASGKAGGGAGGAGGARNRRTLFKRPAQKTPRVQACTRFVKSLFYKGSYMQIGDIVSIVDSEQNVYYAQIRGLLVDAYCEKSAFLTWLIPTQDSPDPKEGFDPATYLIGKAVRDAPRLKPSLEGIPATYSRISIFPTLGFLLYRPRQLTFSPLPPFAGPDEELSRKLSYLEFIMHAPSNYYFDRTTPFPLPDADEYMAHRTGGYIWTRLPTIKRERDRDRSSGNKAAA